MGTSHMHPDPAPRHGFVPPWLLERIGNDHAADDAGMRARRSRLSAGFERRMPVLEGGAAWTVHDAWGTTSLPGTPIRAEGEPEANDVAVNEAAAGISATLAMFREDFGRSSYDDKGAPVSLTVHYGRDYDNAFWDGQHLVFGDGDGRVFERFTKPVDVLAHEFAHAVIEHTAGLVYRSEPGALNESLADVFAACLKQRLLGQSAAEADWLIGAGLFMPSIGARGLRDMARPGTAFDDPVLGRDPQVGHMDDYIVTAEDSGGVHLNSGIPNRAFHLAAVAIGGSSLEGAGRIWYDALAGDGLGSTATFQDFAALTVARAERHADAVRTAWEEVGVTPDGRDPDSGRSSAPAPPEVVRVSRSGGFAGMTVTGAVALADCDPRSRELVERLDPEVAQGTPPEPDRFVYTFEVDGRPPVRVPEQRMTSELLELAQQVLGTHAR